MEKKSQECRRKDEKLRQVHEVIRHSPLVRATPLSSIAEQAGMDDGYGERNLHKTHRGEKENKDVSWGTLCKAWLHLVCWLFMV